MCNLAEDHKIKRMYHLKALQYDLEQMQLRIKELQSLETSILQTKQTIDSTGFLKLVHITPIRVNRYCNRTGKWSLCDEYKVYLHIICRIPASLGYSNLISDQKNFPGNKRKAARRYARELAEAQEATVVEDEENRVRARL